MKFIGLIEKIRHPRYSIPQRIKQYYKHKKFQKYAEIKGDLALCARSDCTADGPGRIKIGAHCQIFGTLHSQENGQITIGDHTVIFERSILGSVSSITVGDCVVISNHVHIYDNNNHPTSPKIRRDMCLEGFNGQAWRWRYSDSAPIVIEDNVWIGENAAILKGVTIGRGAIVASHAVVTKDVPEFTIAAGNPARIVKELSNE